MLVTPLAAGLEGIRMLDWQLWVALKPSGLFEKELWAMSFTNSDNRIETGECCLSRCSSSRGLSCNRLDVFAVLKAKMVNLFGWGFTRVFSVLFSPCTQHVHCLCAGRLAAPRTKPCWECPLSSSWLRSLWKYKTRFPAFDSQKSDQPPHNSQAAPASSC